MRNNPKELTVHFGGPYGKAISENYMSMTLESMDVDRQTEIEDDLQRCHGDNHLLHLPLPDQYFMCNPAHTDGAHSYGEAPR